METGIAKDTLRVWERRYGFPQPVRNPRGERLYPAQQVVQLRQVRRLLDQGLRPGQVLTLSPDAIAQALERQPPAGEPELALIALLKRHDEDALRNELRARLLREGLGRFVTRAAPAMLAAVGNGWARGEVEVFEEHHFSAQIDSVLREAVMQLPAGKGSPRVLLTTLPGEPHTLGLLLTLALMRLEGATCIWLGAQTPESQILAGARAFRADVVGLSFSEYVDAGAVRRGLSQLRLRLPPDVELWCGGRAAARVKRPAPGVSVFADLNQLAQRLQGGAATRAD